LNEVGWKPLQEDEARMSVLATFAAVPDLLRGPRGSSGVWAADWDVRRVGLCVLLIVLGAGAYGAAMGGWRSPLQAGFNVVKFPLLLLTTALGNALLNGMLAPLLGLNVRFRQSLMLVLMSFALASLILGAFAPLIGFIIWNTPPLSATEAVPWTTYNFVQLVQVTAIAFAGVAANVRLRDLLQDLAGDRTVATKVLFAWLAGNLFLGSQLCWILRPFIGSPTLPVEFLRPTAFHGSFYETVFRALLRVLSLND
jgi:hypothetical protein